MPAAVRYEEHGEPGWVACFRILDTRTPVPATQRLELLNRLFFNLCLGNNDAHAKNFALLHARDGGPRLAPAYDLVCTQAYSTLSAKMAMAIGGESDPRNLSTEAWARFARDTGFGLPALRRFGVDMANRAKGGLADPLSEVEANNPSVKSDVYPVTRRRKFFKRFVTIVTMNAERLTESLSTRSLVGGA